MGRTVATFPSTEVGRRAADLRRLSIERFWQVPAEVRYEIDSLTGESFWAVVVYS